MKKTTLLIAATLSLAALGGCATYATEGPPGGYWTYGIGGYDDGGRGRYHSGGGRSEPGNEAGMYPAHPGYGRGGGSGGGGSARGGEAGN